MKHFHFLTFRSIPFIPAFTFNHVSYFEFYNLILLFVFVGRTLRLQSLQCEELFALLLSFWNIKVAPIVDGGIEVGAKMPRRIFVNFTF